MSISRVRRIGGSLMITIPKELVEAEGIREDELVRIEVKKLRRNFFGSLKDLVPMTAEEELHTHE